MLVWVVMSERVWPVGNGTVRVRDSKNSEVSDKLSKLSKGSKTLS